jgi:predicted nucleic acid-binding protein
MNIIKSIIADAGPLIAFARLSKLSLLNLLLGNIIIPEAVAKECLADLSRPGAKIISKAIEKGKIEVHSIQQKPEILSLLENLGEGESAAISLAIETHYPLLIDEKLGRSTAKRFGIKIIGTAGVLILAKRKGLIDAVEPIIQELKLNSYRLSDALITEVLQQAEE